VKVTEKAAELAQNWDLLKEEADELSMNAQAKYDRYSILILYLERQMVIVG
jgi:hypothetical protein